MQSAPPVSACAQCGAADVAQLGATIEAKINTLEDVACTAAELPAAFVRFEAALSARL